MLAVAACTPPMTASPTPDQSLIVTNQALALQTTIQAGIIQTQDALLQQNATSQAAAPTLPPTLAPTNTPVFVATPTTTEFSSCPGSPPQRMVINQHGVVCTRGAEVYLRQLPTTSSNYLWLLSPGTSFTVLDGPMCADDWSWWKVSIDKTGEIGWIAEGGDENDEYFICPAGP